MTDKEYFYLSSSIVKSLAKSNGNVETLVPNYIVKKLKEKYQES